MRSHEEIERLRSRSLEIYKDVNPEKDMSAYLKKNGFTCDNCFDRTTCSSVFDGYNTDGDCLEEK